MKILEFGNTENKKLILIHGFQCPWQIWNDYIEHFAIYFHVIVPVLPGHDVSLEKDEFIGFDSAVQEFLDYYLSRYGNYIDSIYAISMGGVFVGHLLESDKLRVNKLIIESSPLIPMRRIVGELLCKQYLDLTHLVQEGDEKTIQKATKSFVSPKNKDSFVRLLQHMTDSTIIEYIKQITQYTLPASLDLTTTDFHYLHGGSITELFFCNVAQHLKETYPAVHIHSLKGKGHCEDVLMHPEARIRQLEEWLGKQQ